MREPFRDRDFARRQWHRMHAKLSVEYWRRRGFENLVRAREVKAAKRAKVIEQIDLEQRHAQIQGNIENLRPWRPT
jgi:hypothetical protein